MKRIMINAFLAALFFTCCTPETTDNPVEPTPGPEEPTPVEVDTVVTSSDIELSYWVDCDFLGYHRRGYWYVAEEFAPESVPADQYITKGVQVLAQEYQANLLYVFYHRQFEIEKAKQVFKKWQNAAESYNLKIVPTVLLENYSDKGGLNFTNEELCDLAIWCKQNIGNEFGIFDVYSRQSAGTVQAKQLTELSNAIGENIVFVGLQPDIKMNAVFNRGVEDTWTAECQGNTNDLWSNPLNNQKVGINLLNTWVQQRVSGESRPVTWDFIPVAWDYETTTAKDKYGYVCPGDNALYNDPPIPGRLKLCKDAIMAKYDNDYSHKRLGGFSCDLTILQANSDGCKKDRNTFYKCVRSGNRYDGYFSSAMDEIAEIYAAIKAEIVESRNK